MTSLSNDNHYEHDANGNQIKRVIGTDTYLLAYDAENRLSKVCKDTAVNPGTCDTSEEIARFFYDGDGKRVKSVVGSETTLFIGSHFEVTDPGSGQTVTKYYFAGAQRIATLAPHASAGVRKYVIPSSMAVEYLLGDHLGSTSLTTDADGAKVSEIRYRAWGEIRYSWTSGVAATPAYKLSIYTFTGQYSHMDDPTTEPEEGFGLMFYNARWYDPYLNHFTQPDSIIPATYNPQDWNRYSYVRNNPLRYTDPTGHRLDDGCSTARCTVTQQTIENDLRRDRDFKNTTDRNKCKAGNANYCSGWARSLARPIMGFHFGGSDIFDVFIGGYHYEQIDLLFDWKSGTLFKTTTTGNGTYGGAPNGAALEGYAGISNVFGIPLVATPAQVNELLAGNNLDFAFDAGADLLPDVETSAGLGVSIDLDPKGRQVETTAGKMFTLESKVAVGVSLVPSPLDVSGQVGDSTTTSEIVYQVPWWPFR